jgi:hypothetical protein
MLTKGHPAATKPITLSLICSASLCTGGRGTRSSTATSSGTSN